MNDNLVHCAAQLSEWHTAGPVERSALPSPDVIIPFAPRRRQPRVAIGIFGDFVLDRGSGAIIIPANASNPPAEGEL